MLQWEVLSVEIFQVISQKAKWRLTMSEYTNKHSTIKKTKMLKKHYLYILLIGSLIACNPESQLSETDTKVEVLLAKMTLKEKWEILSLT